jgi:hypothetical protein
MPKFEVCVYKTLYETKIVEAADEETAIVEACADGDWEFDGWSEEIED